MRLGPSVADDATLTASTEKINLPGEAVLRPQPKDLWRSDDNSDQNLVLNLSGTLSFNTVAVLYHNADSSALWRIRTANTEAGLTSAPDYDSSTMSMRSAGDEDRFGRFHSLKDTGSQTNSWVRLDFTTLSGMTTLDVGRVMIVNALDAAPAFDWQLTYLEDAFITRTTGATWTQTGRKYRQLSWSYPGLTDANAYATLGDIDDVGFSTPIVAAVKETDTNRQTDWVVYGTLDSASNTYLYQDIIVKQYSLTEFERP